MKRKTAFTLIELLVVVAIIALLISILLPSLSRAREITKRAVCASNIKGIGTGMKVYSNDNLDSYPVALFMEPVGQTNDTSVTFVTYMSNNMTQPMTTNEWTTVHPSRSMFLMVVDGSCTAKQFICPSSGDNEDDMRNRPAGGGDAVACQPGINRFDFKGYPFESYGMQLPFGSKAKPNENLDSRMVIMADKGPYFQSGTGIPSNNPERTPDAAKGNPDPLGQLVIASATTEELLLRLDTEKWRPYNSRNHGTEGQNCLYQDGHAQMEKKPIVGVNFDNIFTCQGNAGMPDYTLINSLTGFVPGNLKGPLTQTDSVIVP